MAVIKRTFNLNVKTEIGCPIAVLRAVIRHDNNRFMRKGWRKKWYWRHQCLENATLRLQKSNTSSSMGYNVNVSGVTWLRRGLRNLWGMPRCRSPRKSSCKLIVANNDNYALAA
jgi:hypothetical protein